MPQSRYILLCQDKRSLKAFSLIELLVVISIVALLISIVLPALGSARQTALTVKCLSNLRQVGIASQLYIQEYNGYTVPIEAPVHWYRNKDFRALLSMEREQGSYNSSDGWPEELNCPTVGDHFPTEWFARKIFGINRTTIPETEGAGGTNGYQSIFISKVSSPTEVVMFADSNSHTTFQAKADYTRYWDVTGELIGPEGGSYGIVSYRHNSGNNANFLFFDYHAENRNKRDCHEAGNLPLSKANQMWQIYPD